LRDSSSSIATLVDQSVVGQPLTSAIQKETDLAQRLRDSVWQFCRADGSVISQALQFRPRGQIIGHFQRNETSWRVHQGQLEFIAANGSTTTRFVNVSRAADGCLELSGPFLGDATGVVYMLRELAAAPQIIRGSSTTRRNLLMMRAGNKAMLPDWAPASARNWDLALSFYGEGQPDWGQEYFIAEKGPKWQPIHRWFVANPELLKRYDYFWFPDDDILTTWENVNEFFDICHDHDLQLIQPALTPDSQILHAVTRQDPNCLLRFTMFVEGMAPAFRADALRLCLPVMQEESRFGWGHDWIFPMLLGYPANKIAIVDACAVKHTRPFGQNTDFAVADAQQRAVVAKYRANFMDHRVRGCIFARPAAGWFEP
jgi:hypothetical protein